MQPVSSSIESFISLFPEFVSYPELVLQLCPLLRQHILRPGQLLVTAGDINDRLYFIADGLVRGFYYSDNDNAITSWFEAEGGYVAVPHSYFGGEPSRESIEVLESGLAFSVGQADLRQFQQAHPAMGLVIRTIISRYMIRMEHQLRALRMTTARERVAYFQTYFPTIYRRAPLGHIASFLSMTPQTLSKIRGIKK